MEIKLGANQIDEAAKNMLAIKKAIDEDGEAVVLESSWDEETKTLLVSYQSVSKEVCVTGKWA